MNELRHAIRQIEAAVGDARQGLPEEAFYLVSRLTPLVNVDLLIKDDEKNTLLTWRDDPYYGGGWHIPGGIIRFKESFSQRIQAVAALELGSAVAFDPTPLAVQQAMAPQRNDRGHFISLLFRCTLTAPLDETRRHDGTLPPRHGTWAWHARCPEDLLSVHRTLYREFL